MRTPYTGVPAYRHIGIPNFIFSSKNKYPRQSCPVCRRAHSGRCLHRTNQLRLLSFSTLSTSRTATRKKKSTQNRLKFMGHCVPFYQCRAFVSRYFFVSSLFVLFFVSRRYPTGNCYPKCHSPNDIKSFVNTRAQRQRKCEKINSVIPYSHSPIRNPNHISTESIAGKLSISHFDFMKLMKWYLILFHHCSF